MKTETASNSRRSFIGLIFSVPLAFTAAVTATTDPIPLKRAPRFILLNDFHIAGFRYYDGARELPKLVPGTTLTLRAEPNNPHDPFAVEILHGSPKLGYVPRFCNRHVSRLLQDGIALRCEVDAINPHAPPWDAVSVRILMPGTPDVRKAIV